MVMKLLHLVAIVAMLYAAIFYLEILSLQPLSESILSSFIVLSLLFLLVESFVHPLIRLILFPLRVITLGAFSLVISITLTFFVLQIYPFVEASFLGIGFLGVGFSFLQKLFR